IIALSARLTISSFCARRTRIDAFGAGVSVASPSFPRRTCDTRFPNTTQPHGICSDDRYQDRTVSRAPAPRGGRHGACAASRACADEDAARDQAPAPSAVEERAD